MRLVIVLSAVMCMGAFVACHERNAEVVTATTASPEATKDEDDSLYPLTAGRSWTYEVHVKRDWQEQNLTLTMTNLAQRKLNSLTVTPQKLHIAGKTTLSFVEADSRGICEVALQDVNDIEPALFDAPRCIVRFPLDAADGWSISQSHPGGYVTSVPMRCTAESVDQTITVSGGSFDRCVKVSAAGTQSGSMGTLGDFTVNIEQQTWLCPGVGLVRQRRSTTEVHPTLGASPPQVIDLQLVSSTPSQ